MIDQNRPVVVITGASAGIGLATARQLLGLGWQVIGVGRDPERTSAATAELNDAVRGAASFTMLRGDMNLMSEVKRLADEIAALTPRVDVLINNAGGMRDRQIITSEGLEATFAVNHLAAFLLTRELRPLLDAAVARSAPGTVRVLAVSSNAHRMSSGLDWDDLQSIHSGSAYGQAKLANLLFTRELARRVAPEGIVAQAMHPGIAATNFALHGGELTKPWLATNPAMDPPELPAQTLVWLATEAEGGREPGRFFFNQAEEVPADTALDDEAAARLWTESEKLLAGLGY